MTMSITNNPETKEHLNALSFLEKLVEELERLGYEVNLPYQEETQSVLVSIISREPATKGSRTMGVGFTYNKPYHREEIENITTGMMESTEYRLFSNVIEVSIWTKTVLDSERLAFNIESAILKYIPYFKKYIDNFRYIGRIKTGFSGAYNEKASYNITMNFSFDTSEVFYNEDPVLRVIEIKNN